TREFERRNQAAAHGAMRAVIVNSGHANCSTGKEGIRRAESICRALANELGIPQRSVFPSSTGVIGVPLPAQKITAAIPRLVSSLAATPDALAGFARAIMTTDTRMKIASARVGCRKGDGVIVGVAKGA